jgi:hypothetical protein
MRRALASILIATTSSACFSTTRVAHNQTVAVRTEPPGAAVWKEDSGGHKELGASPANVDVGYEEVESRMSSGWWWVPALSGAAMIGGLAVGAANGFDNSDASATGAIITGTAVIVGVVSLAACLIGTFSGSSSVQQASVNVGAKLDGYAEARRALTVPTSDNGLLLSLSPLSGVAAVQKSIPRVEPTPPPAPSAKPGSGSSAVVAVFDVEDAAKRFDAETTTQITEYLVARLAGGTSYRVIPRDQLKSRIAETKIEGMKACYDEACQIELGRALAAQKSLATKLLRVGDSCAMTSTMYDLRTETTEAAASARTSCAADALLGAVDEIVKQLALHR